MNRRTFLTLLTGVVVAPPVVRVFAPAGGWTLNNRIYISPRLARLVMLNSTYGKFAKSPYYPYHMLDSLYYGVNINA